MKKIIFSVVMLLTAATTIQAQDKMEDNGLQQILQSYYNIKNALVAGNQQSAADNATAFTNYLKGISNNAIAKSSATKLLKDAASIATAKNMDKQRAAFAGLSTSMTEVAQAVKLTTEPVYVQYCSMKKASWLSSDKGIKNPYYGRSMLTCGSITETIQ